MKERNEVNSLSFGIVYFVMFFISYVIDHEDKIILYPKIGPNFLKDILLDSLIGVAVGIVVVLISQIVTKKSKALQDLGHELGMLIGKMRLQEIFFLAFFSSVGEEFLFRGIIQGYGGLIIASVVFGILHTAPGKKGVAWSVFALIMGFVMGLEYMWRKNILTPIWTHFIVNFFNVYLLQRKISKTKN